MMPIVTLWQPWASLVAIGIKLFETRSWPVPETMIGQRVGVHAAARAPRIGECPPDVSWSWVQSLPRGVVVAFVRIVGCWRVTAIDGDTAVCVSRSGEQRRLPVDLLGDWRPGRWIWELADIEPADPPIPATGRQRFWYLAIT